MQMRFARSAAATMFAVLFAALTVGCGSNYVLTGRVIRGNAGFTSFVTPSQLVDGKPVSGAQIMIFRDPDNPINREMVAKTVSNANGDFTLVIDRFGAGWMDEQWEFRVDRPPYDRLETVERLPSAKAELGLLISLRPGTGEYDDAWEREDLIEQYEKFRY